MHYSIAVFVALMGLLQASANPFTVVRRVPASGTGIETIPATTPVTPTTPPVIPTSPVTSAVEPAPSGSAEELVVALNTSASASISVSVGPSGSSSAPSGSVSTLPIPISVSLTLGAAEAFATPIATPEADIAAGKVVHPHPVPLSVITPVAFSVITPA